MNKEDSVISIKFYSMQKQIDELQQENKELKDKFLKQTGETFIRQKRIDKAIKKAKDIKQFVYDELVDRCVAGATETHYKITKLLDILEGK